MATVIGVISGKGGSGKTTVAINVASCFKMMNKKVICVDCSFGIRNDDIPLNRTGEMLYNLNDIFSKNVSIDEAVVKGDSNHMPDFLGASLDSCPADLEHVFVRLVKNLSKEYEFVIIDTPYASGMEFDAAVSCSDIILAVCTPDAISVANTALSINRVDEVNNNKKKYLVINRAVISDSENDITAEYIIDTTSCELAGIIREDQFVSMSLENGDPIVRYDTYAGRDIENLCRRICGEYINHTKQNLNNRMFDKNRLILKKLQGGF